MTHQDPTTDATLADLTSSYAEARREAPKAPSFLKGELMAMWPVFALAVLMLLVILWDRFIRF
jgi:hypothetical protein